MSNPIRWIKSTGLRCDQTIALTGIKSSQNYPQHLRRIKIFDAEHSRELVFLTNNFDLPALTGAHLYRCRWQVELFFKWIKQHLRIRAFYGFVEPLLSNQSHGFSNLSPADPKSKTFLVTTVIPCTNAVAAINPSLIGPRFGTCNCALRSATSRLTGNILPENAGITCRSNHVHNIAPCTKSRHSICNIPISSS